MILCLCRSLPLLRWCCLLSSEQLLQRRTRVTHFFPPVLIQFKNTTSFSNSLYWSSFRVRLLYFTYECFNRFINSNTKSKLIVNDRWIKNINIFFTQTYQSVIEMSHSVHTHFIIINIIIIIEVLFGTIDLLFRTREKWEIDDQVKNYV